MLHGRINRTQLSHFRDDDLVGTRCNQGGRAESLEGDKNIEFFIRLPKQVHESVASYRESSGTV